MTKIMHNFSLFLSLTTVAWNPASAQSIDSDSLVIDADAPIIVIGQQAAGRNFIRLPDLHYNISLDASCGNELQARAISLSVADTRKSLAAPDIPTEPMTKTELAIPAAQIGPVSVDNFCTADVTPQTTPLNNENESGAGETLVISSAISLQASLLCANEVESRMTYASMGLDVTLACEDSPNTRETTTN